jgi:hypothetical protein
MQDPNAECTDAHRGELDCQRDSVQLAADVDNDRQIGIIELEFIHAGSRAFDEQLDGRKRPCRCGIRGGRRGGAVER